MTVFERLLLIKNYCKNFIPRIPAKKIKMSDFRQQHCDLISCKIHVIQNDTLIVANNFENPLILILADEYTPGGTHVSNAQEETLFRRTTLFSHLTLDMYPIQNDEAILVENVRVFGTSESDALDNFTLADFIACPGLRRHQFCPNIFKDKIRFILNVACQHSYKNVILGALGTGAFGCNKKMIALLFKKVLNEYQCFDNIVFAITNCSTCSIFKEILTNV